MPRRGYGPGTINVLVSAVAEKLVLKKKKTLRVLLTG